MCVIGPIEGTSVTRCHGERSVSLDFSTRRRKQGRARAREVGWLEGQGGMLGVPWVVFLPPAVYETGMFFDSRDMLFPRN